MKGTFEDKDENGRAVEMGKAVGALKGKTAARGKRWRLCEGCDGRVAITFHEVVAEPLGRLAVTEIIGSWSRSGEKTNKQTKKTDSFWFCVVCLFSNAGRWGASCQL